jgi:hypothetical protein
MKNQASKAMVQPKDENPMTNFVGCSSFQIHEMVEWAIVHVISSM